MSLLDDFTYLNRFVPKYPDDTDYNTNSPSYYEYLAKMNKVMKILIQKIYDYDKELAKRFEEWDKNLQDFPDDVKALLEKWLNDGTLAHIINETIFGYKLDTVSFEEYKKEHFLKMQEVVINVKDFGAKGDGVTNDQPAFQSVVDMLHVKGGGTIYVPDGTYIFDSGVKWQSNISLKGNGIGKTILKHRGELFSLIYNIDGASDGTDSENQDVFLNDCHFTDFEIDGSGLTFSTESADGKGIFILYMKRPIFRNVYIHDTIGTAFGCDFLIDYVFDGCFATRAGRNYTTGGVGQSGFGIGSCGSEYENGIVSNCVAKNCGNYGFFVETQSNPKYRSKGAIFSNCMALGNRIGFGNKGSGSTSFNNSEASKNEIGLQLTEGSSNDRLTQMIITDNTKIGLLISADYKGGLSISGGMITRNRKNVDVTVSDQVINGWRMVDVEISNSQFNGIEINRPVKDLFFRGLIIKNNGLLNQSDMKNGIVFHKNLTDFVITDLLINDDQDIRTQVLGIIFDRTIKLKNGVFSNINLSGYTYENGTNILIDEIIKTSVKISNLSNMEEIKYGTGTFLEAFDYHMVTFDTQFPSPPKEIRVENQGPENIWVTDITRFSFIARKATKSATTYKWVAEL